MTYVRVDFEDKYIYLKNDVRAIGYHPPGTWEYRAHELLFSRPRWYYKRIKRMSNLPQGKKVNVWYFKQNA